MKPNRKPLIAGNWKMHKTCSEAEITASDVVRLTADIQGIDLMIAPPFIALSALSRIVSKTQVALGAQNMFWENEGAYTGEISPPMIVSVGCSYAIIGHSERRQHFGETDESVNKKMHAAVENDLTPVFCIGESESQREAGETFSVLDKQIQNGLKSLSLNQVKKLVVAYEPVWAIGTGKTATREQAQEVHHYLRIQLKKLYDESFAESVRILYGGSVKPDNISGLMEMPDVDGALIGGASLDAETFSAIAHYK
ncbi:MAG: triose-phosphate isomerase [Desulfobacterales bacterium]